MSDDGNLRYYYLYVMGFHDTLRQLNSKLLRELSAPEWDHDYIVVVLIAYILQFKKTAHKNKY